MVRLRPLALVSQLTAPPFVGGSQTKDQSMLKKQLLTLAVASLALVGRSSEFADAVVSYDPGIGYAAGYTNTSACLGEPSRVNPFGEPTDPFDPPYGKDQIVSLGESGSLVIYFDTP